MSKSRSLGQILEKSSSDHILVKSSSNLVRMFVLIKCRLSLFMGGVGSKSRSLDQILESLIYTLGATFLAQSFSYLLRMFVLIISWSSLIIYHRVLSGERLKAILASCWEWQTE